MSRPDGAPALVAAVAAAVDAWRGSALPPAAEAWTEPGKYLPTRSLERPVSDTTALLLHHWFRPSPHELETKDGGLARFRYWPHQRRFVESVIYLHEVLGVRTVDDLYDAMEVKRSFVSSDPWAKLGGQLATGSGKTKMMSLLIAWTTLNATREGPSHLGMGCQVLVVAPGLFVKERLLFDFAPTDRGSVFRVDPVVPPALERDWRLSVYGPDTTPLRLDPAEPALIVTNVHQLMRAEEASPTVLGRGRQVQLMFEVKDPKRLEDETTPLIDRLRRGPGLLVINDEAHHVGDEVTHQQFEQKARNKAEAGVESNDAMAWIRSLRAVHSVAGVGLQVDLSATLFEEAGDARKAKAAGGGPRPFRHTIVDYGLASAIRDGVVKHPVLEKVEITAADGSPVPPVREHQPNAWLTYEPLIRAGIGRWIKVRDQLRAEGDPRKPILFLLTEDQRAAREVANFLTYGVASSEDLSASHVVRGFTDRDSSELLFAEPDADGLLRPTVIQIHVGAKEAKNEGEWAKVRAAVNAVDHDEIPNPRKGDPGQPDTLPNPYNVVVSVMMLKEGWDVRNVKVIVPLRSCDSRTLTEQTLGRGLRRMHPAELDEDGAMRSVREELYVMQHPSFEAIIDQIGDLVERRGTDEIDHPPEYVRVEPRASEDERERFDVPLVTFEGVRETVTGWRESFPPVQVPREQRLPWRESFEDHEVRTWLSAAQSETEEEGQQFWLEAAPSYRDYDELLGNVYARPLLRDVQAAFTHLGDVKQVVKDHLEQRTFRLPVGVPLSFDRAIASGPEDGRLALCNLVRPEVVGAVKDALRGPLAEALSGRKVGRTPLMHRRRSAELESYPARKQNELVMARRSVFRNGAFDSMDELRFAAVIDRCSDVTGWVFNHRQGVGYRVPYDWQGHLAWYFPDFVVRVTWEGRPHNVIVEVKGRMDQRDEAKARVGRRHAAVLSEHDAEPWHYLLVHEDPKVGRSDLSWLEALAEPRLGDLLRRVEGLAEGPLAGRYLTRDGIGRRVVQLAGINGGVTYAELMEHAARGEADRDRMLVVAEGLATAREPQLRRLFVDRRTGAEVNGPQLSALLRAATEGEASGLEALDVVYRPVGGSR